MMIRSHMRIQMDLMSWSCISLGRIHEQVTLIFYARPINLSFQINQNIVYIYHDVLIELKRKQSNCFEISWFESMFSHFMCQSLCISIHTLRRFDNILLCLVSAPYHETKIRQIKRWAFVKLKANQICSNILTNCKYPVFSSVQLSR